MHLHQFACTDERRPLHVWCFFDGKPGHQNQTLGLLEALVRKYGPVQGHEITVPTSFPGRLMGPSLRRLAALPKPDLLLGAGHATHLALLRARCRFGGISVVLMKPSLPMRLFDLCVIPDVYANIVDGNHVLTTRGVLNRILRSKRQVANRGLLLIGGPSHHFAWSDTKVVSQIEGIVSKGRQLEWTLATSRRTPSSFLNLCITRCSGLKIVTHDKVGREWLPEQVSTSQTIWVTEDSVSMTYEAVTSGASVGIMELDRPRDTRVTVCIDRLVTAGQVTSFSSWLKSGQMQTADHELGEADRVASFILAKYFQKRVSPSVRVG
jgi:mitochondrial fission protein ELM1